MEELGKKIGVDGMETSTAPALEKAWKDVGFEKEFITMTKSFKQEDVEDQETHQSDLLEVNEDDLLREVANGR